MPRNFSMTGPTRTQSRWAGESIAERLILAKLDPAAFVANATGVVQTAAGLIVVSGTLVGRTYTEREAGAPYGIWTTGDTDGRIIRWDVNVSANNDAELCPRGVLIKENYLPDWSTLSADAKAFIRANYETYQAVN